MQQFGFNKIGLQRYYSHISAWVFSCMSAAYLQNTFFKNTYAMIDSS